MLFVHRIWEVEKNCESQSSASEEVSGNTEFDSNRKRRGTEHVDNEGFNGGGFGDFLEGISEDWRGALIQLNTDHADFLYCGGIEALERESMERNGRVGLCDVVDVVGNGWGVNEASRD